MAWRTNRGMQVLISYMKVKYPFIVIGTIGDREHATNNPSSDHNPKWLNGAEVVNAMDPMISKVYTRQDADNDTNMIIRSKDPRTKYIIWQRRIMSGPQGPSPWVWREYKGDDPHTGHWHHSVLDSADDDTRPWFIIPAPVKVNYMELEITLPVLTMGMSDADYDGYNMIVRVQKMLGITPDGEYGPNTAKAIASWMKDGDGKRIDENVYRSIFGLAR